MTMFNRVTPRAIAELKRQADTSEKQRSRLNLHSSVDDVIQEMIIVFSSACRMPPHKNLLRSESVHVIEGNLDLLVFDQEGGLTELLTLAPYSSGKTFMYRMQDDLWHTLVPRSPHVVVHEIIRGPFRPENTINAPWAPVERPALDDYLEHLCAAYRP